MAGWRARAALITGAGSGIGKAMAVLFGREGAKVMAADINEEAASAVAAQIEDSGGEARSMHADTSKEEDVRAAIQAVGRGVGADGHPGEQRRDRRAAVQLGPGGRRERERRLLRLPARAGADAEAGRRRRDREHGLDGGADRRMGARLSVAGRLRPRLHRREARGHRAHEAVRAWTGRGTTCA